MAVGGRGSWAMLPRVLAVMLAAVLAVQLANFAILQFAPLPQPPVFTVAQVAAVLRDGHDRKNFRSALVAVPPPMQEGRAVGLARGLAVELGLPASAIRLSFTDPPPVFGGGPPGRIVRPRNYAADGDALMVGDFTAGVRRADGRWATMQPRRSGMAAWRLRLFFWLLVAVLTVAPFAWLLARWVTRPVAVLAEAAERIGRNPYTPPMDVEGPVEIADAARVMNEMQRRLTRFVDDRTLMIGAIAHDLRTPLMRLSLRLDRAPEEIRDGVERDVADMQAMIAAATDYVRGATMTRPRQRIDLRSLIESIVDERADRGERVATLAGADVVVDGDAVALRTVVDNLLTNAIRYAGTAEVGIAREADAAVIEVRDHGPGLAPADLERVFEPFFRGEQSRNRETGGMGLGLASVRSVVHLHGGEATLRNHPEGGLVARIALPL